MIKKKLRPKMSREDASTPLSEERSRRLLTLDQVEPRADIDSVGNPRGRPATVGRDEFGVYAQVGPPEEPDSGDT